MSLSERINSISDEVFAMEQEVERLKAQLKTQQEPDARDVFVDLIAPDVEFYEANYDRTTERMKRVVDAYRACRPKIGA